MAARSLLNISPASLVERSRVVAIRIGTRDVPSPRSIHDKLLIAISESRKPCRNSGCHPANAGLAVIAIEVALIESIVLTPGSSPALARDTVFAVIMI